MGMGSRRSSKPRPCFYPLPRLFQLTGGMGGWKTGGWKAVGTRRQGDWNRGWKGGWKAVSWVGRPVGSVGAGRNEPLASLRGRAFLADDDRPIGKKALHRSLKRSRFHAAAGRHLFE